MSIKLTITNTETGEKDISLHPTMEDAKHALYVHVSQNWDLLGSEIEEAYPENEDRDLAIEEFFSVVDEHEFTLEEIP